jgi:hypothetical protein
MAITSCKDWGLVADSRFKAWGKKVTPQGVDLDKDNGYSLGGEWVDWGNEISLGESEYLVVAAEVGSRKNRKYSYRLVRGGAECALVSSTSSKDGARVRPQIEQWFSEEKITEQQYADARNSTLYMYALYIATVERRVSKADVLRDERERLMARIAEIDIELASMGGLAKSIEVAVTNKEVCDE